VVITQFQHQPAFTTPWNPQPDLFLEPPPVRPASGGALWASQWQAQQRRLACHARTPLWQQAARDADRRRPGPEVHPICVDYDWQWPAFGRLSVSDASAWAPLIPSERRGLPADLPRDAQADLLQDVAQPIAWTLSRPCPVIETGHQVRVEFLGCIAWVANREQRLLQLELRDRDGCWQTAVSGFDLDHPLADGRWLTQALLPWLPRIERDFGPAAEAVHTWLLRRLARHFGHPQILAATERQIRNCLQGAPALAQVLRRIRRYAPRRLPTSFLYIQLWRREDFWTGLERRAPHLVLFSYLAQRYGTLRPDDDVGVLRARCRELGLSPAGWRFLCRFGEWAYEGLLMDYEAAHGPPPFPNLVPYLQWLAAAGLKQPLPAIYAYSLEKAGAIGWPPEHAHPIVALDPRVARVLEAHAAGPEGQGRAPIPYGEWPTMLRWLMRVRPELDRNQWQAGWPALRRAADKWRQAKMGERWASAVAEFTIGEWRVRPLTCGRELAAEGRRMRHCVADLSESCQAGIYRVFTVEHADTGAPQVTIGLQLKNGAWQPGQARGPKNADPTAEMVAIANDLLTRYRASM